MEKRHVYWAFVVLILVIGAYYYYSNFLSNVRYLQFAIDLVRLSNAG